jgi:hypothetical protein
VGFYYIYFYGTEDGSEVKVGHTKQEPTSRRLQHENQAGHEVPMRTLAIVLGQRADEEEVKRYFASFRSRPRSKEWFAAGDKMRSYLRWLRDLSFVARDEIDLDRLTTVDAAEWLPNGKRVKQPKQLRLEDAGGWVDPWADLNMDHVAEGDFYTHPSFIEAAREALGEITLDPASCTEANVVVKATRFYSFHENGLVQDWQGRVWLNPPFGNWTEWAPKAIEEWRSGRIEAMCLLSTTRAITALSFHILVREASALFVANGRYAFWGPKATATPDEGHVIFYFGDEPEAFSAAFSELGTVFYGGRVGVAA